MNRKRILSWNGSGYYIRRSPDYYSYLKAVNGEKKTYCGTVQYNTIYSVYFIWSDITTYSMPAPLARLQDELTYSSRIQLRSCMHTAPSNGCWIIIPLVRLVFWAGSGGTGWSPGPIRNDSLLTLYHLRTPAYVARNFQATCPPNILWPRISRRVGQFTLLGQCARLSSAGCNMSATVTCPIQP